MLQMAARQDTLADLVCGLLLLVCEPLRLRMDPPIQWLPPNILLLLLGVLPEETPCGTLAVGTDTALGKRLGHLSFGDLQTARGRNEGLRANIIRTLPPRSLPFLTLMERGRIC